MPQPASTQILRIHHGPSEVRASLPPDSTAVPAAPLWAQCGTRHLVRAAPPGDTSHSIRMVPATPDPAEIFVADRSWRLFAPVPRHLQQLPKQLRATGAREDRALA